MATPSQPPNGPAADALRRRAAAGDRSALDELLARNMPALEVFVRLRVGARVRQHESCSDIVQSVCRELVGDWPRLDFADDAAFRGWLFQTALNKVRSKARMLSRQRRDPDKLVAGTAGADLVAGYATFGTPSAAAMTAEQIARIERAFDELSEEYREVITLARLAGLPMQQVGAAMKRSPAAASMLLGRALAALDDLLQRGG